MGVGYNRGMHESTKKTLEQVVEEAGKYPLEAFEFVRHGLNYAVHSIHGDTRNKTDRECHVSGQQLSCGLRDYAIFRYGIMARTVLAHWDITRTQDFGRIVYTMVENKLMQKTDDDDLRDFDNVFDFVTAFDPPARPRSETIPVFRM